MLGSLLHWRPGRRRRYTWETGTERGRKRPGTGGDKYKPVKERVGVKEPGVG